MTNQITEELVYWDMAEPPSGADVVADDVTPEDESEPPDEQLSPPQD